MQNFVSGSVGSGATFLAVGQDVLHQMPNQSSDAVVVSLISLVGGLVSTLLTNLLKKWLKVKDKPE